MNEKLDEIFEKYKSKISNIEPSKNLNDVFSDPLKKRGEILKEMIDEMTIISDEKEVIENYIKKFFQ